MINKIYWGVFQKEKKKYGFFNSYLQGLNMKFLQLVLVNIAFLSMIGCNVGQAYKGHMLKKGPDFEKPKDITNQLVKAEHSWEALANPGMTLKGVCLNLECSSNTEGSGVVYVKNGIRGERKSLLTDKYSGFSVGDEIEEAVCPVCGMEIGETISALYFYNCYVETQGKYYARRGSNTKCKVKDTNQLDLSNGGEAFVKIPIEKEFESKGCTKFKGDDFLWWQNLRAVVTAI